MTETTSLLPIDVGFDLRLHSMPVDLGHHVDGDGRLSVRYLTPAGREALTEGTAAEVLGTLQRAGYEVPSFVVHAPWAWNVAGQYATKRPLVNDYGTQYGVELLLPQTGGQLVYLEAPPDDCQCDGCRGIGDVWDQLRYDYRLAGQARQEVQP